jgi:hypothetical protein
MVRDPGARRARAALSWAVTIALGALAVTAWSRGDLDAIPGLGEAAAALVALLVLGACAALSVWLSLGGTRIALREGEIEFRPSPLTGRAVAIFDEVRLAVEHTTDDDGDDWFELQARSRGERRTIDRRMNEPDRILGLARWIAERCGAPLDLGRGVEESEEDEALAA